MSRFWGASISIGLVLPTFKEGNGDTFYLFTVSILVFERYVIGQKRHIILEPRMLVQKIEQIIKKSKTEQQDTFQSLNAAEIVGKSKHQEL